MKKKESRVEAKRTIIGSDHAGFEAKQLIVQYLRDYGWEVEDVGAHSNESVDYPDFIHPVASLVGKDYEMGIILCGSGNGAAMSANKHAHIRAALCWTAELASLARQHNNANILAIPARFVSERTTLDMVDAFFSTDFEGGRHSRRVKKIELAEE